ncbi:hypothetical protein OQA88_10638 [Cercophora sp. LCS_1]
MKFSGKIALLAFAMPVMSVAASADPVVTPAPDPAPIRERATTSFYSFVTTPIPQDEHSIGMGLQREGTDEYYWLYCIDNPFTVRSGFAGCGNDDVYTTCSGRVASGIDGDEIRWFVCLNPGRDLALTAAAITNVSRTRFTKILM